MNCEELKYLLKDIYFYYFLILFILYKYKKMSSVSIIYSWLRIHNRNIVYLSNYEFFAKIN